MFETEDEKYMYEVLIDLKDYVPEALLISKKGEKSLIWMILKLNF